MKISNWLLLLSAASNRAFTNAQCDLCYDGSSPLDSGKQVGTHTCAEFIDLAQTIDPDDDQCTNLKGAGLYCDCPFPPQGCYLCEDKSEVPNPLGLLGMFTCTELSYGAAFEADEQQCTAWQAVVGTYCGCSNPIADEGFCRICGSGTLLSNPAQIAFAGKNDEGDDVQYTCAEIEQNVGQEDCATLQENWSGVCCPLDTPSPTAEPTAQPTAEPESTTTDPTKSPEGMPTPSAATSPVIHQVVGIVTLAIAVLNL